MTTELFYAFNTVVTLQAFGTPEQCRTAYAAARAACRSFERRLSRTLPHSDIARLNAAKGRPVPIATDTAALLRAAQGYCADSEGRFDITMGAVVRLWNFHEGTVPERKRIDEALAHVDWRTLRVWDEPTATAAEGGKTHRVTGSGGQAFAQLEDPLAAVDVGGIAKGWIADAVADLLADHGLEAFIVNLGGNVVAHGEKPGGVPWRIGLQDPRDKGGVVGA
ncbi:MAG: FAD:protein FMN transferase, partial [Gordonibacter urolithinfaciens]